jgi:hypothetical protein
MTSSSSPGRNFFHAARPREWAMIGALLLAGLVGGLLDLGNYLGIW